MRKMIVLLLLVVVCLYGEEKGVTSNLPAALSLTEPLKIAPIVPYKDPFFGVFLDTALLLPVGHLYNEQSSKFLIYTGIEGALALAAYNLYGNEGQKQHRDASYAVILLAIGVKIYDLCDVYTSAQEINKKSGYQLHVEIDDRKATLSVVSYF
ncbi:MAG: hypothetical protein A2452_07570 [Candidatus Firestonebacteria bacterium RIFOXYC2_FULL_39_67]|nr:MAG: hypothetical protein A2536_01535 [Candidatus Firestonebacteria bacterium RIFOXYD2_FULL_39_29]OGF52963.1 MAG: hypothetical protein A2497_00155 [Candidatus Firestonebacteria bacterium RifOxyC12_full_39_7]OGF55515.1 MAG: hypothetical protein A2452_07570 [Candidatus Firestonebacteria bacterium RIFOXYC2_FULL_39_67]